MIYILSWLIGTIIGGVVSTLIYHLRTKLGVLYIDECDPEGERGHYSRMAAYRFCDEER